MQGFYSIVSIEIAEKAGKKPHSIPELAAVFVIVEWNRFVTACSCRQLAFWHLDGGMLNWHEPWPQAKPTQFILIPLTQSHPHNAQHLFLK